MFISKLECTILLITVISNICEFLWQNFTKNLLKFGEFLLNHHEIFMFNYPKRSGGGVCAKPIGSDGGGWSGAIALLVQMVVTALLICTSISDTIDIRQGDTIGEMLSEFIC